MTDEANAAIEAAFDASARKVVVSDSHADMGNLLPHRLDQRAELVQGTPKVPFSMMTGIGLICGYGLLGRCGFVDRFWLGGRGFGPARVTSIAAQRCKCDQHGDCLFHVKSSCWCAHRK